MKTEIKTTLKRLAAGMMVAMAPSTMAATIALQNVNVVDVNTLTVNQSQTIIIEDNIITTIQSAKHIDLTPETVGIDLKGKYVIPGLIDAHVHHATDPDLWDNEIITRKRLRKLLQGGVTSVRDMGGDTRELASIQRQALIDVIPSPDIYYSVIIGGPEFFSDPRTISSGKGHKAGETNWMRAVTHDTNLDDVMLKAAGTGATGIKIYASVDGKLVKKLATAAKKHGLKVWGHAYVGPATPGDMVAGGVETISHVPDISAEVIDNYKDWRRKDKSPDDQQLKQSFNPASYQQIFNQMKQNGTILDATLTVFEQRKELNDNTKTRYKHATMLTQLAHEKGIKIAAGTDAFSDLSGDGKPMIYKELKLLVNDGGLSPTEAIQAATLHAAEVIGIEKTTGSVDAGKIANLVILQDDPTADISNINSVTHVIKNGRFILRGDNPALPFSIARPAGDMLWMSGQVGNFPGTTTLVGPDVESQMHQSMVNIGAVLAEYDLTFDDVVKCTLMLDDIKDWADASAVYKTFFNNKLPARSAFATGGLALGAKVEIECAASFVEPK